MKGKKTAIDLAAKLRDIKVAMARTSLSRASIYCRMAQGRFPKQQKLVSRRLWAKSDIDRFCVEVIGDGGREVGFPDSLPGESVEPA